MISNEWTFDSGKKIFSLQWPFKSRVVVNLCQYSSLISYLHHLLNWYLKIARVNLVNQELYQLRQHSILQPRLECLFHPSSTFQGSSSHYRHSKSCIRQLIYIIFHNQRFQRIIDFTDVSFSHFRSVFDSDTFVLHLKTIMEICSVLTLKHDTSAMVTYCIELNTKVLILMLENMKPYHQLWELLGVYFE